MLNGLKEAVISQLAKLPIFEKELRKKNFRAWWVKFAFNPRTREAEVVGSLGKGQAGLQCKFQDTQALVKRGKSRTES